MRRRQSQPVLMKPIDHHINNSLPSQSIVVIPTTIHDDEILSCVCGRVQYVPYPRARCICGSLPLKIQRAIEQEEQRKIKELALAKIHEENKHFNLQNEMNEKQALELNKKSQPHKSKYLYGPPQKDRQHVKTYVNQQVNQNRYALQFRHEVQFHQNVALTLAHNTAQQNAEDLAKCHQEYLLERKQATSSIRLHQTRFETEKEKRQKMIRSYVQGEWVGKKPTSRIKAIDERTRLLEMQAKKRAEMRNVDSSACLQDVVQEVMITPEEYEKRRVLAERWTKYQRAQEVMREAERLRLEEKKHRLRLEEEKKKKIRQDRGEDLC